MNGVCVCSCVCVRALARVCVCVSVGKSASLLKPYMFVQYLLVSILRHTPLRLETGALIAYRFND
jgi:hypothetical protein